MLPPLFGPFGFVMIFGLATAMTLTLVVQPAAYLALERWRFRGSRGEPPVSAVEAVAPDAHVSELSA